MSQLHPSDRHPVQGWTAPKLLAFSRSMGHAFNPGLATVDTIEEPGNGWTAEKLAHFGAILSHGFHPGL